MTSGVAFAASAEGVGAVVVAGSLPCSAAGDGDLEQPRDTAVTTANASAGTVMAARGPCVGSDPGSGASVTGMGFKHARRPTSSSFDLRRCSFQGVD